MTKITLRQQKALETKNKLIDSALRVFSEKGYDSSTTKDIAREAEVTDGLIYHYFNSKEELLWAILEKHTINHELKNTATMDSLKNQPLDVMLNMYFANLMDMLHDKKELIVMFFGEAQRNQEVRNRLVMTIEEGIQPLYQLLKQHVSKDDEYLFSAIRNVQMTLVMYFLLYGRFQTEPMERTRYIHITVQQFMQVISL
ncbi:MULTISPECIES: TetR/AcrR family transcriptional regulator [Paenibacillus]|uniref:TetR/AcrR family transcriptional regulator n=1 Tax=Paenibacillus alvei TaxID=44250 RepID=A0ABT4E3J7_PAEAL|nr:MULTISPECIES: TetR/AcrR family transcriptional regulator [Paenibacillus]MCY9528316.1 TetR/AcrR family transcriptional regulator [Paenibacillus alvei]SDE31491.1 DNA-binding transcriptional regulator, AcrR family [Paenibacillus sp. cl6col]